MQIFPRFLTAIDVRAKIRSVACDENSNPQAETFLPFLEPREKVSSTMRTAFIVFALAISAAGCQNQSSQGNADDGNDYFKRAEADRRYGDGKKAIANYTEAIRCFGTAQDPMLSSAYFGRGLTYYRLGNREDAAKDFDEAERLGYPAGNRPHR